MKFNFYCFPVPMTKTTQVVVVEEEDQDIEHTCIYRISAGRNSVDCIANPVK
jgi:hypothetical protein